MYCLADAAFGAVRTAPRHTVGRRDGGAEIHNGHAVPPTALGDEAAACSRERGESVSTVSGPMDEAAVTSGLLERLYRDIGAADDVRADNAADAVAHGADAVARAAEENAQENTAFLKQVVEACGWPTPARFGEIVSAAAGWLLAFSARTDPPFQDECLQLLGRLLGDGEVDADYFAFTTDRVLISRGRAQRYATQVRHHSGFVVIIEPLEAPARLNARRSAIGLPPVPLVVAQRRPTAGTARKRAPRRAKRGGRRR